MSRLISENIDNLLVALAQFFSSSLEQLDGGGECSQRRTQFVAHVGCEAGLTFNTGLQRRRHLVEGRDEGIKIGVAGQGKAGFQTATGNVASGDGNVA